LKNHNTSPTGLSEGPMPGTCGSASARIPVPIVAANQLGVN
jgi:hypothetical protein